MLPEVQNMWHTTSSSERDAGLESQVTSTLYELKHGPRKHKFYWFLTALGIIEHIPGMRLPGQCLKRTWAFHRIVDDTVDGDRALPLRHRTRVQYVEERIHALRRGVIREPEDALIIDAQRIATRMGINLSKENASVLKSMQFDAQRRDQYLISAVGRPLLVSKEMLEEHYINLDIDGCVRSMLKLYGEHEQFERKVRTIGLLARAVRTYYDIKDFETESRAGLVNIPREDIIASKRITEAIAASDIRLLEPWARYATGLARNQLETYRCELEDLPLKPITQASLYAAFERPAVAYFKRVENGSAFKKRDS